MKTIGITLLIIAGAILLTPELWAPAFLGPKSTGNKVTVKIVSTHPGGWDPYTVIEDQDGMRQKIPGILGHEGETFKMVAWVSQWNPDSIVYRLNP